MRRPCCGASGATTAPCTGPSHGCPHRSWMRRCAESRTSPTTPNRGSSSPAPSRVLGGSRGRRAALGGLAAVGAASLVVNQPMKMSGARPRPDRHRSGRPGTAMGAHADFDVVPVRAFRVSRRVRRCCRRCRAGTPAAVVGGGVGGGVLARVHGSALPERRRRRCDGRRVARTADAGVDAPVPQADVSCRGIVDRGIPSIQFDVSSMHGALWPSC